MSAGPPAEAVRKGGEGPVRAGGAHSRYEEGHGGAGGTACFKEPCGAGRREPGPRFFPG